MSHAFHVQDFNEGYPRLQDRRPIDARFYQPDSRSSVPGPTRRGDSPRKQTLACHFCRERKIACGRPLPGSHDGTCNQCARRNLLCTYPTESRRGQHKRKTQRARDPSLLL
ncbi:hypothetical protein BT96DRAFT_824339 [Gymnopus androsaceus JB14]|uniref:Zn(2)-C6 fungal-type domain-containing protein n=1 Tax=Gymnopus androsaceus JB14 TaxID=1447944 RepID=A0A6A4HG57_9AGAR|nr:hypothetical protein BT96DRAFT_824339 [Gymnopus androsaceus JB14]